MSSFKNAALMRDQLRNARAGKITPSLITKRLIQIGLPDWLKGEILRMVAHDQYNRITCPIEQAMEAAVHAIIVKQLMDEEKSKSCTTQ